MLFLLVFTALALAAVTAVCLPLLRGVPMVADRGSFDRAVYRDQLKEVEHDLARGVLNPAEADQARLEIHRRLLSVETGSPRRGAWSAPSPSLAVMVALLMLGGAVALYWRLGAPSLPDAPFAARTAQREAPDAALHPDLRQAALALQQKLAADPSDATGWLLYAHTCAMLGDWQKAATAYRHAIDLGRQAPDVLSGYGEVLVLAAEGIVSPAAHDAFVKALAGDPKDEVALYYLALGDSQAGKEQEAIDRWVGLAGEIPEDSPMREQIARGVAEAAQAGGLTAPALPKGTPAAQQPGAAPNQVPDAAQEEMIRAMVAKLAAHLQSAPDDLEGWLRLGRSYAVLGETDKAVDAYEHAAKLKPDDAGIKLQEFQVLTAGLPPSDPLPARAVAVLHQVVALAPDQPEALWYLGVQAVRSGHVDEARRDWTKLLATLPADSDDAKLVRGALDTLSH